MNLDELTEAVFQRLQQKSVRVLLIGELSYKDPHVLYVSQQPYDEVIIGKLSPGALLQMPSDVVCQALLNGIPVRMLPQNYHKGRKAVLLRRALMEAEQRLIQFGVTPVREERI